jgi:hypothetical protein
MHPEVEVHLRDGQVLRGSPGVVSPSRRDDDSHTYTWLIENIAPATDFAALIDEVKNVTITKAPESIDEVLAQIRAALRPPAEQRRRRRTVIEVIVGEHEYVEIELTRRWVQCQPQMRWETGALDTLG